MPDLPFAPESALQPLTPEQRADNLARILAEIPEPGPIWVFAYGSLVWDPCFSFDAVEPAALDGYRRAFNFWSVMSRGTPERPGLGLGLEKGGRCRGVAYRLSADALESGLEALWRREMYNDVYVSHWLPVDMEGGARHAIGFVTNTAHCQYAGGLTADETARIIARASGDKGPCRDYLASTVTSLAGHGIQDPTLSHLLSLIDGAPRN